MGAQHIGQARQFVRAIDRAGWIAGRVEHQPFRARRNHRRQLFRCDLKARPACQQDGRRPGQAHHIGIRHPARRGHDDLIPRIAGHGQRVPDHGLPTGTNADLIRRDGDAIIARELGANRSFQFRDTVHRRIACVTRCHGFFHSVENMRGRGKIWLARRQTNHIAPGRAQIARRLRHRHGRGRGDGLNGVRERLFHSPALTLQIGERYELA